MLAYLRSGVCVWGGGAGGVQRGVRGRQVKRRMALLLMTVAGEAGSGQCWCTSEKSRRSGAGGGSAHRERSDYNSRHKGCSEVKTPNKLNQDPASSQSTIEVGAVGAGSRLHGELGTCGARHACRARRWARVSSWRPSHEPAPKHPSSAAPLAPPALHPVIPTRLVPSAPAPHPHLPCSPPSPLPIPDRPPP